MQNERTNQIIEIAQWLIIFVMCFSPLLFLFI